MRADPESPRLLTAEQISAVVDAMDPEALAFAAVVDALELINPDARQRVLNHAFMRFGPSAEDGDLDDEPTPRTFWLDELPVSGDLLHLGGVDVPVAVSHESSGGEFTYRLAAVLPATGEGSAA